MEPQASVQVRQGVSAQLAGDVERRSELYTASSACDTVKPKSPAREIAIPAK